MAGVCVSGVMWAIFQNNAGGAWDNAKKSFEAGVEINGEMTYKGSEAHKAAVTGDTVGDPFKDTSGPSMNILVKLTCLVGLVIAPILGEHTTETAVAKQEIEVIQTNASSDTVEKQIEVQLNTNYDIAHETVMVRTTENGKTSIKTKGTEEEVKTKITASKASLQ